MRVFSIFCTYISEGVFKPHFKKSSEEVQTICTIPQDGPTYRLPAPDGGNNDAGAEYTVVATDNAGNETTATVRTYRRHHEHSYSDWSKDGTSHWHECTDYDCPNRNKSIKDKAALHR